MSVKLIDGYWLSSNKFDPRAVAIYERHYSARRYADGRKRTQFVGPGECMVLLTPMLSVGNELSGDLGALRRTIPGDSSA